MAHKKINIHLFCFKESMCSLIKKYLGNEDYKITCINDNSYNEKQLSKKSDDVDCIIIDNNLDEKMKNFLKQKFSYLPIICLPALDKNICVDNGVKYIHEPLRLSELGKVLNEIFT